MNYLRKCQIGCRPQKEYTYYLVLCNACINSPRSQGRGFNPTACPQHDPLNSCSKTYVESGQKKNCTFFGSDFKGSDNRDLVIIAIRPLPQGKNTT